MRSEQSPSSVCDRREFLGGAAAVVAAMMHGNIAASENYPLSFDTKPKIVELTTRRRMEYFELGKKGGEPLILVHGFLGSGRIYALFHDFLEKNGMHAIAPNLYGNTEWEKRCSVMDAGKDIAALSDVKHGRGARSTIIGTSGGIGNAVAACGVLKSRDLFLVSGQVDMNRREVFALLNGKDQFELNALRGVPVQAWFPIIQRFRTGIRQRVAHRRVAKMAHTSLPGEKIRNKLSATDLRYLQDNEKLRTVLFEDAASHSYGEIVDSIQKMFRWEMDLRALGGTEVTIMHGTADTLVHPDNAKILEKMLKEAGVQTHVEFSPEGHMLLAVRAEEILIKAKNSAVRKREHAARVPA